MELRELTRLSNVSASTLQNFMDAPVSSQDVQTSSPEVQQHYLSSTQCSSRLSCSESRKWTKNNLSRTLCTAPRRSQSRHSGTHQCGRRRIDGNAVATVTAYSCETSSRERGVMLSRTPALPSGKITRTHQIDGSSPEHRIREETYQRRKRDT